MHLEKQDVNTNNFENLEYYNLLKARLISRKDKIKLILKTLQEWLTIAGYVVVFYLIYKYIYYYLGILLFTLSLLYNLSSDSYVKNRKDIFYRFSELISKAFIFLVTVILNFLKKRSKSFKEYQILKNIYEVIEEKPTESHISIPAIEINITNAETESNQQAKEIRPLKEEEPFRFKVKKVNWPELMKLRDEIGKAGEQFVLDFEKQKLTALKREDLISKIVHTSKQQGIGWAMIFNLLMKMETKFL